MKIPRFTIVYTHGGMYHGGGEDDELVPVYFSRKWLEAPSDGVTHVVCETPDIGRFTSSKSEYYYQLPINFHGAGECGASMKIGPYLRQLTDIGGIVKFGGWTSSDRFHENARLAKLSTHVPIQSSSRRESPEDTAD